MFTAKAPEQPGLFPAGAREQRRLTKQSDDQQSLDWSGDGRHFSTPRFVSARKLWLAASMAASR